MYVIVSVLYNDKYMYISSNYVAGFILYYTHRPVEMSTLDQFLPLE